MISDQERVEVWNSINEEVESIVVKALSYGLIRDVLAERMNQISNIFAVFKPLMRGSQFTFDTIWRSSQKKFSMQDVKVFLWFPEDDQLHMNVVEIRKLLRYGLYHGGLDTIVLNGKSDETARFMAFCFIHELGHALIAKKEGRRLTPYIPTPEESLAEEVEMKTFDYKLLLAIGGPEYIAESEKMTDALIRYRTCKEKTLPLLEGKGLALDYCFGPVKSDRAKKERDFLFWFSCECAAADQTLSPELAQKEKYKLLAPFHHATREKA